MRPTVMLWRDRPEREHALALPVAADVGGRARDPLAAARRWAARKRRWRRSRWPWPSSPASPTTSPACARRVMPPAAPAPRPGRAGPPPAAPCGGRHARRLLGHHAHHADEPLVREVARRAAADHPSVAHHRDAVGVLQYLAEAVGDEDAADPALGGAPHVGQELLGRGGAQRGGRLVQDDEPHGRAADRVGARDLDHLALADRQLARRPVGVDAVAGEDVVEHRADQPARPPAPARPPQAAVHHPRFSNTRRLAQSESSWKTQRMPSAWARRTS